MIKVKNVRPGTLILADAKLKLAPGETAEVENLTAQMQRCIDDGLLARIDPEPEAKSKPKPSSRSSAAKTEAKEHASRTSGNDGSGTADSKAGTNGNGATTASGSSSELPGANE